MGAQVIEESASRRGSGWTHANDAVLGHGGVLLLQRLDIVGHIAGNLGRREGAKEVAQVLLLLLGVGRVPDAISPGYMHEIHKDSTHHSMGQGSPLNQSGIKTLYFCFSSP